MGEKTLEVDYRAIRSKIRILMRQAKDGERVYCYFSIEDDEIVFCGFIEDDDFEGMDIDDLAQRGWFYVEYNDFYDMYIARWVDEDVEIPQDILKKLFETMSF